MDTSNHNYATDAEVQPAADDQACNNTLPLPSNDKTNDPPTNLNFRFLPLTEQEEIKKFSAGNKTLRTV
jgi:hypothetical protein